MSWALANSWTFSINVAQVDFTGLGSYSEIMILARLLTTANSIIRNLRVSSNGGGSYYAASGDYKSVAGSGTEASVTKVPFHTTNATAARTGIILISGFNLAQKKPMFVYNLIAGTYLFDNAVALDAVRIIPDSGNITGGSIYVFGR